MRREEEQGEERKERTWKRKSPTVGVRVAWVGLNPVRSPIHGRKRHTSSSPSEYMPQILHLPEASKLFLVCRSTTCISSSFVSLKAVMHVSQSLVEFLCLARLWAFIAFNFFRFEWQAWWRQKWILHFLGWFLLSRFFTIVASLLSLVVLSLTFLYFRLCLSHVLGFLMCINI